MLQAVYEHAPNVNAQATSFSSSIFMGSMKMVQVKGPRALYIFSQASSISSLCVVVNFDKSFSLLQYGNTLLSTGA